MSKPQHSVPEHPNYREKFLQMQGEVDLTSGLEYNEIVPITIQASAPELL